MRGQIIANLIDEDHAKFKMCQCENGHCTHMEFDTPCGEHADVRIHFDGAGTYDLCETCRNQYIDDGFQLEPLQ